MNKTAIKNFAVWARNKLIKDITYKAGLIGVSENEIANPLPQSSKDLQFFDIGTKEYTQVAGDDIKQRDDLVTAIQNKEKDSDYKTAFKAVIEEIAYTWFNRLIAIRFMEVNDYLPSRVRVLSSENPAKKEPDFVTTPFDTDLEFSPEEQEKIMQLKDENKLDDLFRMLFIKQCNKLHEILPELFEKTKDYTELLLNISFTDEDGVVYHLVHDPNMAEDDFNVEKEGQIEIIGWMYQYYNVEPKDETFALLKKNVKITKERIPAATQLFTPDWIVRYMVENSLGRLWVEGHPNDSLKANWKYYLEEAQQEQEVQAQLEKIRAEYKNLNPEDIKVIDPCMGSGHILVYCFDVLMQIYEAQGYTQRDAAQSILENNLYGLDIDRRAAQMAYFAVMMKARQYDRRIFGREITPHVYAIEESNGFNREQLKYFGVDLKPMEKNTALIQVGALLDVLHDATEYGSILNIENYDWTLLSHFANSIKFDGQMNLDSIGLDGTQKLLVRLVKIGKAMAQKYNAVVTNPPYMGQGNMNLSLQKFLKIEFPDSKSDLSTVFMEKCIKYAENNGYVSMLNIPVWMYLGSYEKLRKNLLKYGFVNVLHFGRGVFGSDFGTVSFVLKKSVCQDCNMKFLKLYTKQGGIDSIEEKEKMFFEQDMEYIISKSEINNLPGATFAYWISKGLMRSFYEDKCLGDGIAEARQGLKTSNNEKFLRLWHEIEYNNIAFGCTSAEDALHSKKKWFPYNKGGKYRKWYGNDEYVIDWENNGQGVKDEVNAHYPYLKGNYSFVVKNESKYFLPQITWTVITSGRLSLRYKAEGFLFDGTGSSIFASKNILFYLLGLLNSTVGEELVSIISPALSCEVGHMVKIPIKFANEDEIIEQVKDCIELCKNDWDEKETSWGFNKLTITSLQKQFIEDAIDIKKDIQLKRYEELVLAENRLNEFFEHIYDITLPKEEISEQYVSIRLTSESSEIRELISYSVGCMLGRYSLDVMGVAYSGGDWDSSKYTTYQPDADNCLPITDEPYFEDDIVGYFVEFIKVVYGKETLEENLDFIAKTLGNKGDTSREIIRNYFLNDFIKDHIKIYQKRPIYWLFDSGKQNGFKALVYMHRWNADTVGNLRVEYLHKIQRTYESEIIRMQEVIDNSHDSREVARATKRKDKLQKQLKETKDYDAMLAHIAFSRIEIDLDDGVKVNYEKVQTGRDRKKMQILAKI